MTDVSFINDIQITGLDKVAAYKKNFPDLCIGKTDEEIEILAKKRLSRKDNDMYIRSRENMMEEINTKKALWNRELSTKKLTNLMEQLERTIFNPDKPNEKMAVLGTYLKAIEELNNMYGMKETKINLSINPMQMAGANMFGSLEDKSIKEVENSANN